MIEFDDAQQRLAEAAPAPTRTERVTLAQARGRVLADDIRAELDLPPADSSSMDGYAVRMSDLHDGVALPVSQCVYAGMPAERLAAQTAARVFTGSLIPPGADAVVMQEDVEREDDTIRLTAAPQPGQYIRRRGEDTARGALILSAGQRLDAEHVGLLASQGLPDVAVFPRLRVGILTTGDELVEPGQPRETHQIYNSNAAMLAALVERLDGECTAVLHAADDTASHAAAFKTLCESCDLVLSVGGASVGDKDLVKPVLESMGAKLDLWKVRMKPGKPVALAHLHGTPIICLPGNPVSSFVVFALMVSPLMRRMQGRSDVFPYVSYVTLRTDVPRSDPREEFLRARLRLVTGSNAELELFPKQGSATLSSLVWASGLARIPADTPVYDGEKVAYYELARWLS